MSRDSEKVKLDFGAEGGMYEWATAQEAITWLQTLRAQWSWLGQPPANFADSWSVLDSTFSNVTSHLQNAQTYSQQNDIPSFQGNLNAAKTQLQPFISTHTWLLPNNSRRAFIESLRESGRGAEAAVIVGHWLQRHLNAPVNTIVSAILQLEFHERGIKDRVKTESTALKKLAGDLQSELTNYQTSHRSQKQAFADLQLQFADVSESNKDVFATAQTTRSDEWKSLIEKTQAELDKLKSTYDEFMTLAAPVEYWSAKRKKHMWMAIISFATTIISMLVLGFLLHRELSAFSELTVIQSPPALEVAKTSRPSTVDPSLTMKDAQASAKNDSTTPKLAPSSTVMASPTTWKLGSMILLATLSFWFIRILVRIFLSNLHLENDAAERVTMAKTYLALIRDGALNKGENITSVLAALFRPTGDGIVKDEGLPPTAMEWFTKLGGVK